LQIVEVWAYASIFLVIVLAIILYRLGRQIGKLKEALERKQTGAYQIGIRQIKGDLSQILGTFSVLTEYEELILLSTTSKQGSVDILGIKDDSLDFLEFKKDGAVPSGKERKIKKLVEDGKVSYKILDVSLPEDFSVKERR
jgi:predicted Holliday junction resolvase-like endonuclease